MPKPLNDSIIHVYIPRRDLATIALHYAKSGQPSDTMSSMARKALQDLANLLVEQFGAQEILSSSDASLLLQELFPRSELNPSGRGLPSLTKNLQRESELRDPLEKRTSLERLVPETQEIYQEKEEDLNEALPKALEEFRRLRRETKK